MAPRNTLRNAPSQPYPHSVDLLRNRNPASPLSPFDGTVAAFAQLGVDHYFITTNTDFVPRPASLALPHQIYLRSDMRYGPDDPTLWPQQWTQRYCHLPLIPRKGSRPDLDIMWWNPSQEDFVVGSAITRGLGKLKCQRFSRLLPPLNELVARCNELRHKSPKLAIPLFGTLIQQLLMWLEQLESLPTTFPKMVFALTSLQRAFLELEALYQYMTVYKLRIDNYMAPPPRDTPIAQCVGAFTAVPTVAQQLFAARIPFWFIRPVYVFDAENILKVVQLVEPQFGLPDDNAHAEGAPPALYTGNSTEEKIAAIQRAAVQTPWYHDPFETSVTRVRSPSPAPVASTSHSVAQPRSTTPATSVPSTPRNRQALARHNPYPATKPASAKTSSAGTDRDKFHLSAVPEMPLPIVSMAGGLARVDQSVEPYSTDTADRRYIFPEPALLVNTPYAQRRNKLLHHWSLLADGFIYVLTQHPTPQLLSGQQWRDILDGQLTKRGEPGTRRYKRSESLEDRIRPALQACNITSVDGFPVPSESVPEFSLNQTREIVWQVVETNFRFEFCALDKRASRTDRLAEVKDCFAGHMLVGIPLEFSKRGWASTSPEERHRYVGRTVKLMLDWTTKSTRPDIIRRIADHRQWSAADMQHLETAVCEYYTQAFWEYFGRVAVVPMRLDHDLGKEDRGF
ncbi:hypothetical protein C8R44DRAFT_896011 [Mycena epipterygia]|nr:hypothetical protein C8R44DRAFT_896011 [Mycena epipterygia]